jgi:CBS domain-containing protein
MSYRNHGTVLEAVDSLRAQSEPLEIVVSHSGGGPTPDLLAEHGVTCVASGQRRLPGAARNAGIAATSAPFVSFLAADCLATPGWAAARMARHRAGAVAVANSLAPAADDLCSRAAWLFEHSSRLPLVEPIADGLRGVSYARDVLDAQGPFREDVLVGEDTEMNQGLIAAGVEIEWAPEIVTLHRYPTSAPELILDAWTRGRHDALASSDPDGRGSLVWRTAKSLPQAISRARGARPQVPAAEIGTALPLITACWAAKLSATAVP